MNRTMAAETPAGRTRDGQAYVTIVAAVAALGGLLFGYDTGIISSALLFITREFALGTGGQQIVASAIIAGAVVGAMLSGPVSDRLGRRLTVMLAALIFGLGALATAAVGSAVALASGRFVLGIAIGAASQIVPVYIAEVAPARNRGALVILFQLAVVVGILVSYVAGWLLSGSGAWRSMFALGVVPAVVLLAGMLFLPESPRWLVLKGRDDTARATLRRVRASDAEVDAELAEIVAAKEQPEGGWSELRQPWMRLAPIAGIGIAMFSQITGINAVLYYAPTILANAGFGQQVAIVTTVGVVLTLTAIGVILVVDRIGRRRLLLALPRHEPHRGRDA